MNAATEILHPHAGTFMDLADIGTRIPAYRPTFSLPNGLINASFVFVDHSHQYEPVLAAPLGPLAHR